MKNSSLKIIILLLFLLVSSISPIFKPYSISKNLDVTPIFTDSFENKINTESSLTSPNYKETIKSSNKISFINGKVGLGVHLDSLSSYVGYNNKYINPEEGTIRLYFKPDSNIYTFYNTRQPEWKDYGSNKPRFSGYMIDTVGYLPAFKGGFSSIINFSGDPNNKNIQVSFETWSGSAWSQANFTTKNDLILSSDKFYDFAFTWSKSEGKIKIYIDGELKTTGNYNTLLNNKELFFIGHNPFQNYWPYGPHSLIGTYDELKIYNVPLKDFGTTPPSDNPNKPPRGLRAYPGDNKVLLEWDPPEDTKNLTGYYLYRSKQSGQYISPAHDFSIEDTKYIDMNVDNGTTYYYVCKVVYKDKTQSPPSNEVMVTPKQLTPIINITDNQKVNSSSFTFTGKVDIGSKVFVNGNEVSCDSNGNFTATVTLNKGSNTITIEVRNKPGDYIKITKVVIYEEISTPPKEINENEIIIILQINNPYMIVNGVKKEIDPGRGTVPVIIKGRTLVPIRAIIEELGGTVDWDGDERKVTIKFKNKTIELWIDKKIAKVDGTSKELDVPPMILNGRTMLPLRFVTEELGCTVDWEDKTKTVTITYKQESQQIIDKISSEGEKIFTSSGGELILSDGTKLSVSPNSFSKDTKVTLKSIINPSFSSIDTLGFEITGLKDLKGEITLYVNGEKNLKNEELNIFGYDFDNDEKIDFNYNYEPSSGLVTIKISPLSYIYKNFNFILSTKFIESYSKILGFKEKLSVYVGWVPYYTAKSSEKIIRTPYYAQIGGSCASTCAQMLLKKSDYDVELFNVLKSVQASDTDFGLGAYKYADDLKDYLSAKTGYPVIHIPYFGIPHLKWKILGELDKGHPAILNLGEHVILVVGYTDNGNSIIIHDPQDFSPANSENGTMYTVRSWDWIKNRHKSAREKYYILYADGPFATGTNVTVECPGKSESGGMQGGDLSFYTYNKNTNTYFAKYGLQIKPSSEDGYIWTDAGRYDVDYIGTDAEILRLSIPIFNASDKNRNAELKVAVEEDNGSGVPGKTIASFEQNYSIEAAKLNTETKATYEYDFKSEDIRNLSLSDSNGKQKIFIHAYLHVDGDTSSTDSFMVKATLDVMPKVTSITPTSGKPGDIITINGFAFGKTESSESKVTINDDEVDIVSWSDKVIKVELTQDIESGPVVVYTGEKYEYKSNDDVIFSQYKCDGNYSFIIYKVPIWWNGRWDVQDFIAAALTFSKGTITAYHVNKQTDYYFEKVSGTYDDKGNITFTFTFNWEYWDRSYGEIYTGTFTGKYETGSCNFKGIASGKVRNYFKMGGSTDFDETTDFTSKCDGYLEQQLP